VSAVRVSVPASTANLGPGFDALGLALELRNEIEMELRGDERRIEIEGEGAEELPRDSTNLIFRCVDALLEHSGRAGAGLAVVARNRIPLASGLGSSAATAVGALAAANRLFGAGLDAGALLGLAARIEGHADNAAASLYGGLNLCVADRDRPLVRTVSVPAQRVVVVTPDFGLSTGETRAALPRQVSLSDAVFNIGRALLVVEALRSADWELLGRAVADRLHQPHRAARIPGYADVTAAARSAGAAAVAISGGGPSLAAFCPDGHQRIGDAMIAAWRGHGIGARCFVLDVAERGLSWDPLASPAAPH
jgi:homoserine kinase